MGKIINPPSFMHSTIFASFSKHHEEDAYILDKMMTATLDFSIASKSSREMGFPLSSSLSSLKVMIPFSVKV